PLIQFNLTISFIANAKFSKASERNSFLTTCFGAHPFSFVPWSLYLTNGVKDSVNFFIQKKAFPISKIKCVLKKEPSDHRKLCNAFGPVPRLSMKSNPIWTDNHPS